MRRGGVVASVGRVWRWTGGARPIVGLLALVALTVPAAAGAFLQKPDEGIAILGGAFSEATRAYDAAGRLVPIAQYRKFAPLGSKRT